MTQDEAEERLLQSYGIRLQECSPEEWLNLAIETEDMAKSCGPFDPAYAHLMGKSMAYMKAGALAERLQLKDESVLS